MQIPCVYLPGPAPAVTVANTKRAYTKREGAQSINPEEFHKVKNFLLLTLSTEIDSCIYSQHSSTVGFVNLSLQSHRNFMINLDIIVKTRFFAWLNSLLSKVVKYSRREYSKFSLAVILLKMSSTIALTCAHS